MKLQKRLSRRYKDKTYYKYSVNIPENYLKEASLKEGDNLKISIKKSKIILEKD